ncbi:hypothetical protein C7974DRAFT_219580 [Boeremia exigua]|uniref:uncharacterized protein n=1 Tax=Boeremia exigua TaxID=749465 RepID=UPI001E8D949F|nr:uncharacterized protein C7974DRAFT_219580 [Boeremia exigua]KAH6622289.1 hypothetical protein C7974DRAFT_219580 [Boeremia exigua]
MERGEVRQRRRAAVYVFLVVYKAHASIRRVCCSMAGETAARGEAVASDLAYRAPTISSTGQHQHYKHHHRRTTANACSRVCTLRTPPYHQHHL